MNDESNKRPAPTVQQIVDEMYARTSAMTSPQEEIGKATDDARLLGTGFLMVTTDGVKRVDAVAANELRPPPEHADKSLHWVQFDMPDAVKGKPEVWEWGWRNGVLGWLVPGRAGPWPPNHFEGYRYLGPAEWKASRLDEIAAELAQLEPAARPDLPYPGASHIAATRIAELEAENARLDRKLPTLQQANRLLDPSATERVAKFWMDRERSYYGTQFERFAHVRLSEVIRTSRWMGLLSITERLSAPWHHLPCITDGAALPPVDDKAIDHAGPRDTIHDRAYEVAKDLMNGRVTKPSRDMIRKALDKADAPATGRQASDGALGRALRVEVPR